MSNSSEFVKEYRTRMKARIVNAMGGKCVCCNYDKCNAALELHHLNPTEKEYTFGKVRSNPQSLSKLIKELKKCVLVCCLCHREIHAGIREVPNKSVSLSIDGEKMLLIKHKRRSGFLALNHKKWLEADLTRPTKELALEFDVSPHTITRWRKYVKRNNILINQTKEIT